VNVPDDAFPSSTRRRAARGLKCASHIAFGVARRAIMRIVFGERGLDLVADRGPVTDETDATCQNGPRIARPKRP
jgi:hypothetical protein